LGSHVSNLLVVPPRITVDEPLAKGAEALVSNGLRELPVFQAGGKAVAGQISRWGLLEILRRDPEIAQLPAHAVMTPDPLVVTVKDTIDHALDLMRRLDEPTIPVVDKGGDLAGVVSARDVLRLYAGWAAQGRVPKGSVKSKPATTSTVEGVMTSPVVEAPRDATVAELSTLMLDSKASSVVIVDNGKPKGIVTKGDLLELVASVAPREGCFLQVTGLEGHDPFMLEDVFSVIEPAIKKIAMHARPMSFNAHVMEHHRTYGHRGEVRARLQTDRGLFTASAEDDDLLRAVDDVLQRLESQVRRDKDKHRPSPNKARAGAMPRGRAKLQ
jgi:CBS domain-containing protein/ribosome-associated translation inhibitor RaiA